MTGVVFDEIYDGEEWDDTRVHHEQQGLSLYDQLLEKLKAAEKKNIIHRIVIICNVTDSCSEEAHDFFFKSVKALPPEDITGFLLVYRTHCIHVLESTSEILTDLIRIFHKHENEEEPTFYNSKILVISHDIMKRLFHSQYLSRKIDTLAASQAEYEPTESNEKLICDVLAQALKLGAYIDRTPKPSLKAILDSLSEKVPEYLPAQEIILHLLASEDRCMTSFSDYLDMYDKPLKITLGSDVTWPMEDKLFPLK